MPSKIIPCSECEAEREIIEKVGDCHVISCEVLPEDRDKPEDRQRCKLEWECDQI